MWKYVGRLMIVIAWLIVLQILSECETCISMTKEEFRTKKEIINSKISQLPVG